ncbi:hypothetical protein [Clostridium sp. D53t1_180928_C8]|uniref:hypothetical protein n=1 Tax=Clostridium sp. D53t1_180928_C8 TaxID=2787101 RepID=UPI0018AB8F4C|nr:hypothetical protein [Clostridium sp. D53t1_180928_C8]
MSSDRILKLLNEYKETEKCLSMGIDWLNDSDYAKGKLDLVKVIISDLEKLLKESN